MSYPNDSNDIRTEAHKEHGRFEGIHEALSYLWLDLTPEQRTELEKRATAHANKAIELYDKSTESIKKKG